MARPGLFTVQALAIFLGSGLDESRSQVQDKWAHYRGAGADDCEIDFQNPRQSVPHSNPSVVVGENLPGVRGADDAYGACDEAEAHEEVECDFGPDFEAGVPEEKDGEGGADEVCYY